MLTPERIAIVIPTMNQARFLARALGYYQQWPELVTIYIGDSSDLGCREQVGITENCIEAALKRGLSVHYQRCPSMNEIEAMNLALEGAEQSYVAFAGDDDFLIPESLVAFSNILDWDRTVASVNGIAALFTSKPFTIGPYKQRAIVGSTAKERVLKHFNDYHVGLFALQRMASFRHRLLVTQKLNLTSTREVAMSGLAAMEGSIQHVDRLFLLRDVLPRRTVTGPIDYRALEVLFGADTMATYRRASFYSGPQEFDDAGIMIRALKRRLNSVPGLVFAYQWMRSRWARNDITLAALRSPRSRYYADFKTVDDFYFKTLT